MIDPLAAQSEQKDLNFDTLGMAENLRNAVQSLGYMRPTQFQFKIFQEAHAGKHVACESGSNYGKVLAYSLPILSCIDTGQEQVQALVICANKSEARQVGHECQKLSKDLNINIHCGPDILKSLCHIAIIDAENLKTAQECLEQLKIVYLDGLSYAATKEILSSLEPFLATNLQVLAFGQECSNALRESNFNQEQITFVKNNDEPKMESKKQNIYHKVDESSPKPRALLGALELHQPKCALISCNEPEECNLLVKFLSRYAFNIFNLAERSSSPVDQKITSVRENSQGKNFIFVITNSQLNKINLEGFTHIVNYDVLEWPDTYESLVKNTSSTLEKIISLVSTKEISLLGPIKTQCQIEFQELDTPNDDEITSISAKRILSDLKEQGSSTEMGQFQLLAEKMLAETDLVEALAYLLKTHIAQRNKPVNTQQPESSSTNNNSGHQSALNRDRGRKRQQATYQKPAQEAEEEVRATEDDHGAARLYITLGRQDGFNDLAMLAQHVSEASQVDLGHFSGSGMVRDMSAHIEVDSDVADMIIDSLHNTERPDYDQERDPEDRALVICERARPTPQRNQRRPQRRRNSNYNRRS